MKRKFEGHPRLGSANRVPRVGDQVKYWSASRREWFVAKVLGHNTDGTYELNCKTHAEPDSVRECKEPDDCHENLEDLQQAVQSKFGLNKKDFSPKFHFIYTQDIVYTRKRGLEEYRPPVGWVKLALNLDGLYKGSSWLDKNDGWPVV